MRFANFDNRAALIVEGGVVDVEEASGGQFSADPAGAFQNWKKFSAWAKDIPQAPAKALDYSLLGCPSPSPAQIFAIGLNYLDHAMESGVTETPNSPVVFTKFRTCITGPETRLKLPSANVDWEVELVAVIGKEAIAVGVDDALGHVAGLSVGQDYSERVVQAAGAMPQFSLAKSFPGFGPVGPWLVSLDEIGNPDDLAIRCEINGETMQSSRTSSLIFSLSELVSRLSQVCTLLPGDIIFTGTPSGVGGARNPKIFLRPGDEVISTVEGIGSLRQICE
ncbi:fumarylacetoacetate hydrolase family protein [Rhizorhapis suberifaciens]|uniref:2-keto-4-pentenoate hydratase/2-oxohepta-3-ene-1,7-dioic acid hydratase in catechol pathway n=1 Tax=Rhizorhapis suberifaciens TaxID=13656 RepID=A0A840HTN9_9SPHN|nr:fumarylacetoacetate hydrolase family protein [Rhizorhapis suberifaciens]MBB4641562.1 2-keto-4-pentenoate hydratase/2-oxohepta-3-ene-1,7-dioic acid hydratase in catechol pathway [Rhizorhapis suberifaciens]